MRGEPPLWFDGGEVLQVIAGVPAQVLDEPVEQRGEVQRVAGGAGVVVGVRVGGCSVLADPAVRRARQSHEQGRPEGLAVRRGVGLADRPRADRAARQGSGVLPPPGRPMAPRPRREHAAAHPGFGDLLVQLADPLVQLADIQAVAGQQVPGLPASRPGRVTSARWSSVAGSGSITGSWSRCQPSRHCAARRIRARSAQDGHTDARVCPHGIRTCSTWPVSISVRRSCTGRRQAPCSAARSLTTWRASGCGHPLGPGRLSPRSPGTVPVGAVGVERPGVAAQAALGAQHRRAGVDQDQPGLAYGAGLVGAPGGFPHRPPPGR